MMGAVGNVVEHVYEVDTVDAKYDGRVKLCLTNRYNSKTRDFFILSRLAQRKVIHQHHIANEHLLSVAPDHTQRLIFSHYSHIWCQWRTIF